MRKSLTNFMERAMRRGRLHRHNGFLGRGAKRNAKEISLQPLLFRTRTVLVDITPAFLLYYIILHRITRSALGVGAWVYHP